MDCLVIYMPERHCISSLPVKNLKVSGNLDNYKIMFFIFSKRN